MGEEKQKGAATTEPRGKVKNAHSICSAMLIADGGQGGQGGIEESGERGYRGGVRISRNHETFVHERAIRAALPRLEEPADGLQDLSVGGCAGAAARFDAARDSNVCCACRDGSAEPRDAARHGKSDA